MLNLSSRFPFFDRTPGRRTTRVSASTRDCFAPVERCYAVNLAHARFPRDAPGQVPVAVRSLLARLAGLLPPGDDSADDVELDSEADAEPTSARELARSTRLWSKLRAEDPGPEGWVEGHVGRNIRLAGNIVGLSPQGARILQVPIVRAVSQSLASLFQYLPSPTPDDFIDLHAGMLWLDPADVRRELDDGGPLLGSGLVRVDEDVDSGLSLVADDRLIALVLERELDRERFLARFLTREPPTRLEAEDFAHLAEDIDALKKILKAALAARTPGINIRIFGPTGTGKTEFVRWIGRELGVPVYAIGPANEQGESPSPQERRAALLLAYRVAAKEPAIFNVDECEDLHDDWWAGPNVAASHVSKVYWNGVLERAPVPTFWIGNDKDALDAAYRRRTTMSIPITRFEAPQRRKVWGRVAGADLAPAELDELAERYEVSPAEIASAVATARLAGEGCCDRSVLARVLHGTVRLMDQRIKPPAYRGRRGYRLDAVNATADLSRLAERLASWTPDGRPGPSICLFGRSGTGKSEYVHHLATRMKRRVVVHRASDIESCWVGKSEQNLAAAFGDAPEDAVLLFDEVDGLVRDRRLATRSWEVTLVNEFLQQLEVFPGVVACTSNLYETLDHAILRRFTHKVEFLPLRPAQAVLLFEELLAPFAASGLDAPCRQRVERALAALPDLVPGDFAAVVRRLTIDGRRCPADELVAELEAELRARGHVHRPIGF